MVLGAVRCYFSDAASFKIFLISFDQIMNFLSQLLLILTGIAQLCGFWARDPPVLVCVQSRGLQDEMQNVLEFRYKEQSS